MDTSEEDRQQEEITVLKAIYAENFIECPPPKAWKVRTFSLPSHIVSDSWLRPVSVTRPYMDSLSRVPQDYLNSSFASTIPRSRMPAKYTLIFT